jgi:hypothetical protein
LPGQGIVSEVVGGAYQGVGIIPQVAIENSLFPI